MHKATTMVALVALLAAFALVLMASNNPAQANPTIVTVDAFKADAFALKMLERYRDESIITILTDMQLSIAQSQD
jgi:hypothetical protein